MLTARPIVTDGGRNAVGLINLRCFNLYDWQIAVNAANNIRIFFTNTIAMKAVNYFKTFALFIRNESVACNR